MATATARSIDFHLIDYHKTPMPHRPIRNKRGQRLQMTPKQMRERVRRSRQGMKSQEFGLLYKPVSEWDPEELARGRPKDRDGEFKGVAPKWLTREVHEEAMTRFRQVIRDGMNSHTNIALKTIRGIMENEETDDKGRALVSANAKLDAAKFLIDHALGKPKQRIETDISVKLQGMLASAIITPGSLPAVPNAKELASPRGSFEDLKSFEDAEWSEED
jgi:hypothetical protein